MDTERAVNGSDDSFGIPIYTISKSGSEEIRISLNEFRGLTYIDLRVFYRSPKGFLPTKKGITLKREHAPDLIQGIAELASALGLDEEE